MRSQPWRRRRPGRAVSGSTLTARLAEHDRTQVRRVDLPDEAEERRTLPEPAAVDGRALPVGGARGRGRINDQHSLKRLQDVL